MIKATRKVAVASLVVLTAAACDDVLVSENLSSPDVDRVFATPDAVEQTIGTGYQSAHNSFANNALMPELLSLSLEHYSALNNFNMGVRVAIPRTPIANYTGAPSTFTEFSAFSRAGRLAANAINALDKLIAEDVVTPEDGVLGSVADDLRARAFGFFVLGVDQGWLAMYYDSAGVVRHGMPADSIPPLSSAEEVMAAALEMLDTALVIASDADAADAYPLPDGWLGGNAFSQDEFMRLIRSYRARFRAGMARTKAERDAADWVKIKADALAGIESDFMVESGGSTGWNIGFVGNQMHVSRTWSSISPMYYGMADTTGGYDAWIETDLTDRDPFLIQTPDRRFPAGATRSAQATASGTPDGITFKPYIRAFTSEVSGDPWGDSYYGSQRTRYIRSNNQTGPWPEMMKAEIDMLAAEAYLRENNFAAAAALIDVYRTANNLPPVAGITDLTTPVPGATYSGTTVTPVPGAQNCVPRVPTSAGNDTQCGNIWEAMKWEKRMETAFTAVGMWFFDSRGWGDLPEGTVLEYPVPYQELNARAKPTYTLGGGLGSSAPAGTYGF